MSPERLQEIHARRKVIVTFVFIWLNISRAMKIILFVQFDFFTIEGLAQKAPPFVLLPGKSEERHLPVVWTLNQSREADGHPEVPYLQQAQWVLVTSVGIEHQFLDWAKFILL